MPVMAAPRKPKVDKSGRTSAGLLVWRRRHGRLEVLLGHPGGPYFAGKDADHWTVLKGEVEPEEDLVEVARREFAEETGQQPPAGPLIELGEIRQKSGKVVRAWAVEGDLDPETAASNSFEMEWPPRSGHMRGFPEIDRVGWFDFKAARVRIKAAQAPFLDRLERTIDGERGR
jgi:predicted NUDIX family NTP pyrophosphohydrolase